jgi:hypothetical protein
MAVLTPSCSRVFHRKPKPVPPPPPIAQPLPQTTTAKPNPQPLCPEPPQLPVEQAHIPPLGLPQGTLPPAPPRPKPQRTTKPETATPVEAQPTQPVQAIPQLEQMLSPEQQRAYNEEIDRNIGSAQKTVALLNARKLTREQSGYLDRVVAFIQQAIEARKTDLLRARNLAERANVLAEDLLRSIQ